MRILLVTDAWHPQVNGVVRTLDRVRTECEALGHAVEVVSPDLFRTVPCPTYPEIRLALFPGNKIANRIDAFRPDAIHIATEGPLGFAARRLCVRRGLAFTTSYHTRFPEYVAARLPIGPGPVYRLMRWFHGKSSGVMVATRTIRNDLEERGFESIRDWSRGVDHQLFKPGADPALDLTGPVFTYVGRVAVEKNLPAFLDLDLPGTKLVVGGGPDLDSLRKRYPDAVFTGAKHGEDLVRHYAAGDVFVFPSLTDTFGLVMVEAMACGLPVAAFPVPGPLDVVDGSGAGVLDRDLRKAALGALDIPKDRCIAHAQTFTWQRCAEQFVGHLRPVHARV